MKRKLLLTVLITAYNHEDSIAECIESVLEQKTKYPFTIWILEDCSTDRTLSICEEYANKKPEVIRLIAQPKNTRGKHAAEARKHLSTKYFTILEGDDKWCDKDKIKVAIDILEENPEYITFAHDTLYNNIKEDTRQSLVHDIHKAKIKNPVTLESAPYLHTSSRVHRNVIDLRKNPIRGDIYLYYAFLDKGLLYYHDKVMSVYNITGKGMWSSLNPSQQASRMDVSQYKLNKLLGYRHDQYFTGRVSDLTKLLLLKKWFGIRLGWKIYTLGKKITKESS